MTLIFGMVLPLETSPIPRSRTIPMSEADKRKGKLVLVGNPNVGKSVIFGYLTGRYTIVSNYPGTTVEVARGEMRLGGRDYEVIDTPGTNSLVPQSEDERVTRDILLRAPPDII